MGLLYQGDTLLVFGVHGFYTWLGLFLAILHGSISWERARYDLISVR